MGLRKTAEVAGVLVLLVAIATNTSQQAIYSFFQGSLFTSIFFGLISLVLGVGIIICFDIIRLNPADSHTATSLVYQYFAEGYNYIMAWKLRQRLYLEAKDMKKQQKKVFRDIMNANKDSAYGRFLRLGEVRNIDDFRKKVPFSTFDDIDPYIQRTLQGEENMVTTNEVKFLCFTAGTTGKNKRFVGPKQMPVKEFVQSIYYSVATRLGRSLGRPLLLFHDSNYIHTPNGIPVLPLSVVAYPYEKHYLQPECVYNITDEQPFLYLTAVFSLRDEEVIGIKAVFASMMYSLWHLIDANWEQICDDIERGEINKSVKVSEERRHEINSYLTPDPKRAALLRREFQKGMKGIAKRIWPRMYQADMICSGSLAQCTKLMAEREMAGIPILSCFFSASECMGGLNTSEEVDNTSYTLYFIPYFFEWIPEENASESNPDTLLTHQLETGKKYEIVVTSHAGLTRYRLGDIFHIVKKIEECPVFQFSHRTGQMLDMVGEKVTEVHFANMITSFFEKKGLELIDYTACESVYLTKFDWYEEIFKDSIHKPQCYLIFVDVKQPGPRNNYIIPADMDKEFDAYFCDHTELFKWLRGGKAMGQMKMVQVEHNAFLEMKEIIIGESQTQQYKVPRAIRRPDVLKLLVSRIIESNNNEA